MNKQKPVWRMNTGVGVPSDLGGRILYSNGLEVWTKSGHWYCHDSWGLFSGVNIYAYQTTRAKAAKYERVDCQVCGGKGWRKLKDWITKRPFKGVCIYCKGKGYKMERIK